MDFSLSPEIEGFRRRVRDFVAAEILPLETDPTSYDAHENIAPAVLAGLRAKAKAAGLWAPQMPSAERGRGCRWSELAAAEERWAGRSSGRSSSTPPRGRRQLLLPRAVAREDQRRAGCNRSSMVRCARPTSDRADARREVGPGGVRRPEKPATAGRGRKWLSPAPAWRSIILIARTSDDARRGLSAFLFERDAPGWEILRRIPIMGPEEHGGHCELAFDGLEIPDADRLMGVGDGLKVTQIRLGTARLTHCMRWLGMAKRALEIAGDYVRERDSFGIKLRDHEGVQWLLGEAAMAIEIGRLLTMKAAWKLDGGDFARREVSMAKVQVADALHQAVDTAL
jgi:acyl-CoA dehydrogenase